MSGTTNTMNKEVVIPEFTQIMEVMRMHETYYTPEQLAQLAQLEARREEHRGPRALASLLDSGV